MQTFSSYYMASFGVDQESHFNTDDETTFMMKLHHLIAWKSEVIYCKQPIKHSVCT